MKLSRLQFLHLAAAAAALPAVSRGAWAQTYPIRPVHLLVGVAAGATNDLVARLIGQYLSQHLGQQFIVENRSGAGGNLAAEVVVRAAPDGYTLFHATTGNAISVTLYERLSFNFVRDMEPVAGTVLTPLVMEVHPSVPAKTVPEFIAYAKANPGKVNMASAGNGTAPHVADELFKMMANVNLVHVPYRGSAPALTDLLGGHVQVTFDPVPASVEYIRTGRLRALAVTTKTRSEALPDIPALADFLPDYEASNWWGVCAPKNTPVNIVEALNREINAAFTDPKIKARLADLGAIPLRGSPADFGKLIADETEKWAKVIRFAGIKAD
jgi:tripartite-type tricarboxylate transporter receptor subunit TctC